jgi:hypothetical protein
VSAAPRLTPGADAIALEQAQIIIASCNNAMRNIAYQCCVLQNRFN